MVIQLKFILLTNLNKEKAIRSDESTVPKMIFQCLVVPECDLIIGWPMNLTQTNQEGQLLPHLSAPHPSLPTS